MSADAHTNERRLALMKRFLAIKEARESMAAFMRFMMSDPEDPDDATRTLYDPTPQGSLLCQVIEDTVRGKRRRTGVSMPPQHGKTIHLSTYGLAWIIGNNPRARVILATYNEIRAGELGEDLLAVLQSQQYQNVFPEVELMKNSKSKTSMRTTLGGRLFFTGAGGTITGRTANYFIIDDPIKDDEQVQSEDFREKLWKWFYSVAYSRGGNSTSMIVVHTRWHEDDLLGRLCDEDHPERTGRFKGISEDWDYVNLPGVITDPALAALLNIELEDQTNPRIIEQFGDKPMAALYPKEKSVEFFSQWRRGDTRTFDALVMGRPAPDDGVYFLAEWLDAAEYDAHELPSRLTRFGASDHAVSVKQERDYTVLGCVGVDDAGTVWVLPDVVWDRMETDRTVEELVLQMRLHKPGLWWLENELISKSFGPFLRERMLQEQVYCTLSPVTPSKDKATRARAIQGRMSLGTVRFPRFAPWWSKARAQLLRFPYAANDDFVDWIAHVGQGLMRLHGPGERVESGNVVQFPSGSPGWVLESARKRAERDRLVEGNKGW